MSSKLVIDANLSRVYFCSIILRKFSIHLGIDIGPFWPQIIVQKMIESDHGLLAEELANEDEFVPNDDR